MTRGERSKKHARWRFDRDFRRFLERQHDRSPAYLIGTLAMIPAVGLALFAFLGMVRLVGEPGVVPEVDLRVQELVEGLLSPGAIRLMVVITALGGVVGMTILSAGLAVLLWRRRWWRQLVELLIAVGGGAAAIFVMKAFFQRARPVEALFEVRGLSFPSGHAFISMVFFGFVAYLLGRSDLPPAVTLPGVLLAGLFIALIGVSRVYLGVHFLTDVVGGYAAGFLWLVLTLVLVREVGARYRRG